ncbi:MAG TPA: hypothetical protein IAB17_06130 [Candidatus Alectryocaccobium stercorigallinarum]|nr:hypothetical protein [Candidatus Alectryocaccobium stercorigallinarum]
MSVNPIAVAYVVMVVGILFFFIYNKKKTREIRLLCNGFAGEFAKLSNNIIGGKRGIELRYHSTGGGGRVKADERQSEKLTSMMKRALEPVCVEGYAKLLDYAEQIDHRTYRSKTHRQQFNKPVDDIYNMTYVFLNGCQDISTVDTKEKAEQFNSFINDQVKHRMTLLRLISGDYGDEYRKLNTWYYDEMVAEEHAQMEKRMKRGAK